MDEDRHPSSALPPEGVRITRERAARFLRPMPYEDDLTEWKQATLEQKGEALAGLLRLVKAIGNYPPKRSQFPGWKHVITGGRSQEP